MQKQKILFHQDNATSHTSAVVMEKIHKFRFERLDHPLYAPDQAPCEFFLFPQLKIEIEIFAKWGGNHLRGQLFWRKERRVRGVKETGEVCRITKRLCSKRKEKKLKKKCIFVRSDRSFCDYPRNTYINISS